MTNLVFGRWFELQRGGEREKGRKMEESGGKWKKVEEDGKEA